ncbi:MAG: DNA repair protein RecO C-terminal domain-containing protein, partial [Anaerolineales bacterium]
VCPKCGASRPEAIPVRKDALRYLRHLQRSKWQQVSQVAIPEGVEIELANLMEHYLTYLLERKLNTSEFLREIHAHRKDDSKDQFVNS